ncbi:MAG TPA: hypothetical protein VF506_17450, partial [Streptosporangiaceae bacterium]
MTPAYHDRELGLIQAERINRLMGLRLKYLVSIPLGVGVAYFAGLAGANTMVATVTFVGAQVIYGWLLGWYEARRCRAGRHA